MQKSGTALATGEFVTQIEDGLNQLRENAGVNAIPGGLDAATVSSTKVQTALLDASFAGQQFGSNSKEIDLLGRIE